MKNILTFGGSTSRASINKTLASYVAHQIDNININDIDLNDFDLPLYSYDLENAKGIPKAAHDFSQLISDSDGIIMSLAEHNGFTTAAFKNLTDWISRIDQNIWKKKPMFLMATSPGARGGSNVLRLMKEMMPHFGGNIVADFSLPSFYENFSDEGLKKEVLTLELKNSIHLFEDSL